MKDIIFPITTKYDDKGVKNAESGLKNLAAVAAIAVTAVAAVTTAWVVSSAKQLMEIEKLNAQTEAAIKSTGNAAGRSIEQINKMNASLEKLTGIEAEVIQEGQNMLLTFTQIKGDQFDEATEAALNLSVALGKDMQSSAMLVGKALNDPIAGLSALSRAGIQFTDEQKDTIKTLVELGDVAGAQTIILAELEKQFGGSAEAFGETTAGQIEKVKNSFGTLGESVALSLMPLLNEILPQITSFLDNLLVDPEFIQFQDDMAQSFKDIFDALFELAPVFQTLLAETLPALTSVLGLVSSAFGTVTSGAEGAEGPLVNLINVIDDLAFFSTLALDAFNDMLAGIAGDDNASEWNKVVGYMQPVTGQLQLMADLGQAVRDMLTILDGSLTTNTQKWNAWRDALRGLPIIGGMIPAAPGIRPYQPGGLKLAEGGIVPARRGGTLATIGEGGQAEAVIPLDRFDDVVGRRGGSSVVINVNGGLDSSAAIGEAVVNAIRKYERTSGAVFAKA
jgi:hypothetical protein